MTGYCILRRADKGASLGITVLGLVDRGRFKGQWWTSDSPAKLMVFQKPLAAQQACKRLKYGRPWVTTANEAKALLAEQDAVATRLEEEAASERLHRQAMNDQEQGWDSHKDTF